MSLRRSPNINIPEYKHLIKNYNQVREDGQLSRSIFSSNATSSIIHQQPSNQSNHIPINYPMPTPVNYSNSNNLMTDDINEIDEKELVRQSISRLTKRQRQE